MNKTVVGWSSLLLALGVVLVFLPHPGPWFAAAFFAAAWAIVVFWGSRTRSVETQAQTIAVEPLPEPEVRIEVRERLPEGLLEELQKFRASLEILGSLKTLVVDDTEAAVVRLTEALFSLVGNSKDVSAHIERSLAFITNGDSGLGRTVANLEEQVRVFEALAGHFAEVKSGLSSDIGALTHAVGSINQFSGTLSDLADQTNVLAINASIEAARVGVHGRGFAVIANHVQNLARNSKEISEKMAKTIREVVSNVEASFERQSRRIGESETLILHSERELRLWSDHVGPQVAEVQAMISDSRRLAEVVTEELGDVTVSLQFQDRTRQILEHMTEVLEENSAALVRGAGIPPGPVPSTSRDAAFDAASKHFTIQEEWAIGPHRLSSTGPKSVELF